MVFYKKITVLCMLFSIGCFSIICCSNYTQRISKPLPISKLKAKLYIGDEYVMGNINYYVWGDYLVEQRIQIFNELTLNTDTTGNIISTDGSTKEVLYGFFLIDFLKGKYIEFDQNENFVRRGSLNDTSDIEIAKFNWDLIDHFNNLSVDDFSFEKDTLISSMRFSIFNSSIITQDSDLDIRVLMNTSLNPNWTFRPVSNKLSNKFEGIITQYELSDNLKQTQISQVWEIEDEITEIEEERIRKFQLWYSKNSYEQE